MTRPAFRRATLLVQAIATAAVVAFAILASAPVARADDDGGRARAAILVREPARNSTETRAVSGFRALTLHGPWHVVVRQGGREGVSITGAGNVRYAGDPAVTSAIVGHGRVVRR